MALPSGALRLLFVWAILCLICFGERPHVQPEMKLESHDEIKAFQQDESALKMLLREHDDAAPQVHDGNILKADVGHVDLKTGAFPNTLGGVPLCACPPEVPAAMHLSPLSLSLTYTIRASPRLRSDLSGSPWGEITLSQDLHSSLGIVAGTTASHFAWINPGGGFSRYGGFVYTDGTRIVGANRVCTPAESTHILKFKSPIELPNLPMEFPIGRMFPVNLRSLMAAGALRFTWIQKEETAEGGDLLHEEDRGGFLYEMNEAGRPPRLVFFEMQSAAEAAPFRHDADMQTRSSPRGITIQTSTGNGSSASGVTLQVQINGQNVLASPLVIPKA